jgi:dolichol-phosphate mannosyltransferase
MVRSDIPIPAVSIIIPTLNEAENIYPLLTRIFETAKDAGLSIEVVFVDDNSKDGTREQIRGWQRAHPVNLICREGKEGLASAVIEGARTARGGIAVVMDADLSHPPEMLPELVGLIQAGTHDMVIGSRYTAGGSTPDWPWSRKLASRLATIPARILSDPQDPMAGFFAVGRSHLADLDKSVSGFKIGLEVLVSGNGKLRVAEVPITFYDRYKGKSKMSKGIILDYFRQLLTLIGVRTSSSFQYGLKAAFCIGGLIDFLVFYLLHRQGIIPGSAHIGSFLAASMVTVAIHCKWTFQGKNLTLKRIIGVMVIYLLVLFLRGGILGDLLHFCPPYPAIAVTILVSIAATALGLMIFSFAGYDGKPNEDTRMRIFCVGVVVYSLLLHLVYLGLPALLEEEAYYWNYAQHPALSYLDHPAMVAILIRIGTFIFGDNEFGVRACTLVCWLATASFSYGLTKNLYGRGAAFRSLLLLSIQPVFFTVGLVMTPDAPLTVCWSATIFFLYQAFFLEKPKAWIAVGIFLGLGMISKYTIVLLGPAILLFILIDPQSRRWLLRPGPYLAVLIALVIFSPVIIWNAQHNWASFVFQGERRVTGLTEFSTHVLIGQILLLLTPTGVLALLAFLRYGRSIPPITLQPDLGRRTYLFFMLLLLSPLSVFFIFSLTKEVQLNWTGPLWLAIVPFVAASMNMEGNVPALIGWCRRLWPSTVVAFLLLSGLFLHYFSLGLPMVPMIERPFLTGWESVVPVIERIVETEKVHNGERPFVVGMDKYKIASGLAFYRYKNAIAMKAKNPEHVISETLSGHLFGWTGLMYQFWFPPDTLFGKNLLLVSSSRNMIDNQVVQRYAENPGDIREISIEKDGRPVDRCFIRLAWKYHRE